jgi:hypothetical protein
MGGLFHTLSHPVSPTKRPNAKRKSGTKAFFDLFELISPPPSTCPITALVDPPAVSGCVRGVPCRSTTPTSALNCTAAAHCHCLGYHLGRCVSIFQLFLAPAVAIS